MEEEIQIDQVKNMLIDNAKFLKELYDGVNELRDFENGDEVKSLLNESVKSRLNHIAELVELKVKNTAYTLALQTAKNSSKTVEEFEEKFSELRAAVDRKSLHVKNMADYRTSKKVLEDLNKESTRNEPDDDNVEIMDAGHNIFSLYDPWSKLLLRNPVKNSICGHIYDSDSVNAMIKDNLHIRCPILGCTNQQYIIPNHIVVDKQVCIMVQERLANECSNEDESDEDL